MSRTDLRAKAERLLALHVPGSPLVLVNVWDAATARMVGQAGASALATTSAGIAFAQGYPDGEVISRAEMLEAVAVIARAVELPVSADMEAGYGGRLEDAAETAAGVLAAGAVGLNLEDCRADGSLFAVDEAIARIRAVREAGARAGVALVLNARTDVFIRAVGEPQARLGHAITRGRAYLEAGADCAFVPSVNDAPTIEALVRGIGGPVNVLSAPGGPSIAELAELGVARVSVGSAAYRAALAVTERIAREAYGAGSLALLHGEQFGFADAQTLMEQPAPGESRV